MGKGIPSPQPTRRSGERRELGVGRIACRKLILEFSKHVWTPLVAVFAVAKCFVINRLLTGRKLFFRAPQLN